MAIAPRFTAELLALPETGMGWQLVEVQRDRLLVERVVVVNASTVAGTVSREARLIREGKAHDRVTDARQLLESGSPLATIQVLTKSRAISEGILAPSYRLKTEGPASDAPVEGSQPDERFMRFSAFANDRRVLADGSVSAGTYVTTHADGMLVKTGREAVARYALPNPDPAVHRFHLRPPVPILVRRGIVQPAYSQPGGGVEVIFEHGAPAGTLFKTDQIPPG